METRIASTFLKVAELGNVTKAAKQLGYSQTAVTAQIQQLEKQLGVPLFDRLGRGVQLTDAGKQFRSYAIQLVNASEDADAFAVDRSDPAGNLVIEAGSSPAIGLLPKMLPRFHRQYPHIHLTLRVSEDTDILIRRVRENSIDFAMFIDARNQFDGCVKAAERPEEYVFVAPASDPITKKKQVTIPEIFDDLFVSSFISSDSEGDLRSVLDPYLQKNGYDLRPSIDVGTNAAIVNFLLQGRGRSFLPHFMVQDEIERGSLALIHTAPVDAGMYTQVFYNSNRWINPQMQAFLDFIRSGDGIAASTSEHSSSGVMSI